MDQPPAAPGTRHGYADSRARAAHSADRLVGIEPNPGPSGNPRWQRSDASASDSSGADSDENEADIDARDGSRIRAPHAERQPQPSTSEPTSRHEEQEYVSRADFQALMEQLEAPRRRSKRREGQHERQGKRARQAKAELPEPRTSSGGRSARMAAALLQLRQEQMPRSQPMHAGQQSGASTGKMCPSQLPWNPAAVQPGCSL